MIIVFGSLNIDMVMRVPKLPYPGETVLCPGYALVPGGKGANQALAAEKIGAEVKLFGKVGKDDFGAILLKELKKTSLDLTGVTTSDQSPTGCASICVDPTGENFITVASGANLEMKEADIPDFLLATGSTLLMQMETPMDENWKLIKRAKIFGARTVLNLAPAQPIPEEIIKSLDVLVMNEMEAMTLALHLGFESISPSVAAHRIAAAYNITSIVTLGPEGSLACTPEGSIEVKALDIKAVDTTAAGDAFVGVLAASLDEGIDLPLAMRRASVASGLTCTKEGAQTSLPTKDQVDEHLTEIPLPRKIA